MPTPTAPTVQQIHQHTNIRSGTLVTCYECGTRFRTHKDAETISDTECCGCSDEEEYAA